MGDDMLLARDLTPQDMASISFVPQKLFMRHVQLHTGASLPAKTWPNLLLGLHQPAQEMQRQCPMHPTGLDHPLSMSVWPASPSPHTRLLLTQPKELTFHSLALPGSIAPLQGQQGLCDVPAKLRLPHCKLGMNNRVNEISISQSNWACWLRSGNLSIHFSSCVKQISKLKKVIEIQP